MPEGPEVKRMSVDLSKKVSAKKVVGIDVLSGRYTKKPLEGLSELKDILPTKVIGVGCHGKFSYILTSSGYNVWITYGMTGQWSNKKTNHSRVCLKLEGEKNVYFNDMRNFGTVKIVYGKSPLLKKLKSLGPDLLAEDIDEDFFLSKMREKNQKEITSVLMDQKVFAGIGNYVKAESLWLSKINPTLSVGQITDEKLKLLCVCIKKILRESYNTGGATFRTHSNLIDAPENYGHRFLCYGRKIDADGHKVFKIKTKDGRTTHWSPERQKEERC